MKLVRFNAKSKSTLVQDSVCLNSDKEILFQITLTTKE